MSPSPVESLPVESLRTALTQRRADTESTRREGQIRGDSPNPQSQRSIGVTVAVGAWPVETDIYILPDGRVVVADLPAELAGVLARLGQVEPCELTDYDCTDSAA